MNDHPDGPLDRERETFLAALEKTSPDEREAFLDQACSSDAALRAQVEALLRHHAEDNFLEEPARGAGARAAVESTASEGPGTVIGRYKLLEKIGEGGYGVVYVAEQREPVRRRVALKVIKLGMDTRSVVARFEAERQALALMDHPHIAKVLDAGPTQTGRPYFVMEVVRGIKITDYCDQHQLSTLERLDLFMQVCRAVQHAHQKGIIHRDLKPSNILVAVNDGVAAPKVIDFGIAKATEGRLTDKTVYTELHQFLGTPAYMSPEQAEMTSVDIDTRSDIYSLGVLLYELLTSKTPFEHQDLLKAGLDTMRQTIRVKEPPRPSTRLSTLAAADLSTVARARRSEPPKLIHSVRGDLDWIVMKCLEKDRNRRYETANGLARDIERHLDHEPVNARPPSAVDRVQKIVRRHKPAFAAGLSLALVLTIGAAVSTTEAIRATRAERAQAGLTQKAEEAGRAALKNAEEAGRQARVASEQELLARRRFYAAEMNLAMQAWQAGDLPRTLELLETQRPAQGQSDLRSFEWFHLWNLANARLRTTLPGHAASVGGLAFSPDGKTLASCGWDSSIRFWDLPAGRQKEASRIHSSGLDQVAFTPDGSTLGFAASFSQLVGLWDVSTGKLRAALPTQEREPRAVAFSPDGKLLASGGQGVVRLWDVASARELTNFSTQGGSNVAVAFLPDGSTLVSGTGWGQGGDTKMERLPSSGPLPSRIHFTDISALAINPDGKTLATANWADIQIWDARTAQPLFTLKGHSPPVMGLVYLPDGKTLASCAEDRTIRLWQLSSNELAGAASWILGAHLNPATCLAVSVDGTMLASGSSDGSIKLWNLTESQEAVDARTITKFQRARSTNLFSELQSLLLLPDQHTAVSGSPEGTALLDIKTGLSQRALREATGRIALSPNGQVLATSSDAGFVKLWDILTGGLLASVQAHPTSSCPPFLSFSPDGRKLATAAAAFEVDGTIRVWDANAGLRPIQAIDTHSIDMWGRGLDAVAFSPDGKSLAAALHLRGLLLFGASGWRLKHVLNVGSGAVGTFAVVFSPDSQLVAVGRESGVVQLWEVQTGRLHATLKGHTTSVYAIAFSPDGTTVATGSGDQTVKLWDVATGQERVTLRVHHAAVTTVAFTADGDTLITADHEGMVWVLHGNRTDEEGKQPLAANEPSEGADEVNEYAWALVTNPEPRPGDGQQAVDLAEKAASRRGDANILDTLAAAYALTGQFEKAVAKEQEAIAVLLEPARAEEFTARLKLYQAGHPYRGDVELADKVSDLLSRGKFAEAEILARKCLAIRQEQRPDSWRTFNMRSILGGCLLGQKKYAEAEPLLVTAEISSARV